MAIMQILVFVIMMGAWFGAHLYIGKRVLAPIRRHRRRWKYLIISVLTIHALLAPMGMSARFFVGKGVLYDILQWATYIGMGAFSLTLCLMLVKDLLWWIGKYIFPLSNRQTPTHTDALDINMQRRNFMANSLNVGVGALALTGSKVGIQQARKIPDVVEVSVPVENLHPDLEGFLIVQLSDIHIGPTIKRPFFEDIVKVVNNLNADMIAITGDLVDGFVEQLWHDVQPITTLKSRYGTFFATGNHEYYWDAPGWCEKLSGEGIHVLLNEHHVIRHNDGTLIVGGCTDYSAGRMVKGHETNPQKALEGAPEFDMSILLAHQPKSIHAAAAAGYNLQISGHTHGGQMWPWNFVVGLVHPFSVGLGRYDKTWIYVSRGTGYWGPPMRLGAPSEITAIRLTRA